MKTKKHFLILVGIALIGLFLRLYQIGNVPTTLYWDETAIGYDAYSIATTGHDMHGNPWWQAIFPSYGDYKLPFYIWLTALSIKIFGVSEAAVRLPSAILGTGLIFIVYLLGSQLFDRRTGLTTALIVSLSPWGVIFSRTGFEANAGVFFVTLAIVLLIYGLKKPYLLLLAGFAAGLGVYSYFSVRIIFLILGGLFLLYLLPKFRRKHIPWLMGGVFVFILLMVPIYQSPHYAASNQFRLSTDSLLNTDEHVLAQNEAREKAGNTLLSRAVYHRHWFFMFHLIKNIAAHVNLPYLFIWGDDNLRHGTGESGLFYLSLLPVFLYGTYRLCLKKPRLALVLATGIVATIIPAAIPLTVPHALRSLNGLPLYSLVIGWGLKEMFERKRRLALGILILITLETMLFWHDYSQHYPQRSYQAWQGGFDTLSEYIKDHYDEYDRFRISSNDGRMWLYPLFYMAFDPIEARKNSTNYTISSYGKITFEHIDEEMLYNYPLYTLMAIERQDFEALEVKPLVEDVITDHKGEPQFYLIKSSDNVRNDSID